jgi:capsular polysaccharide transport system permease protein
VVIIQASARECDENGPVAIVWFGAQMSVADSAAQRPAAIVRAGGAAWRLVGRDPLLLVTVVIPTLLAICYFGVVASDVYVSESRFIVRGAQQPAPVGVLGTLLQSANLSRSLDDAHAVHDYVMSRDALRELENRLHLVETFKSSAIDLIDRFGALGTNDSFEALFRYYRRRVSLDLDTSSSIATLRVSAFTATDAQRVNEAVLDLSERFVNQLSERARADIVRFASDEVAAAEHRAQAAAVALAGFRAEQSVMDPERQSAAELQQAAKIEDQYILAKTELAQLLSTSPKNPQIPALRTRIAILEAAIDERVHNVTGARGSLSAKSAGYMQVALEREFAERQLGAAMTFLETARNEAQRQQLYLERIVAPNMPDYPAEPRRLRAILITFVLGSIAWAILSLLAASIREHFD